METDRIDAHAHTLLYYTTQWAGEHLIWLTNTDATPETFALWQADHRIHADAVLRDDLSAFGKHGQVVAGHHPVFRPRFPQETPHAD